MSDPVDRLLPPPRQLALEHALTGRAWGEIARLVGVDVATVRVWRRDPLWAAELAERQEERRAEAARLLEAEIDASLRVIVEIRDDKRNRPEVRLKAANDLLDRALGRPIVTATEPEMSDEALAAWLAEQMGADEGDVEADTDTDEG